MMVEQVDEQIAVVTIYYGDNKIPLPHMFKWKGRRYLITKVDMHHPFWEGKTLHHVYSVSDGSTYFRLDFNTRSQQWKLMELSDGIAT